MMARTLTNEPESLLAASFHSPPLVECLNAIKSDLLSRLGNAKDILSENESLFTYPLNIGYQKSGEP